MNNLIHNFPIHYAYSVNKAYRELNLERVLDEDTGVFLFFLLFFSCSTGLDSCFWEFHPSSLTLEVFVFFLIFCESLAQSAKSRGVI